MNNAKDKAKAERKNFTIDPNSSEYDVDPEELRGLGISRVDGWTEYQEVFY
jgi:hypothetical protein